MKDDRHEVDVSPEPEEFGDDFDRVIYEGSGVINRYADAMKLVQQARQLLSRVNKSELYLFRALYDSVGADNVLQGDDSLRQVHRLAVQVESLGAKLDTAVWQYSALRKANGALSLPNLTKNEVAKDIGGERDSGQLGNHGRAQPKGIGFPW